MLKLGLHYIDTLNKLKCEDAFIQTKLNSASVHSNEELLLRRRAVVFDDALREASIGGDRLWSFAKQLAGVTSETVESIMVVDDTQLQREQSELRKRRDEAAKRASEQQFLLTQHVFKAALGESGLRFGIDSTSDGDTKLNLLSVGVRTKISELSQRPDQARGFFANSVELDNLLSGGAGGLSMQELFEELRFIGRKLQESAFTSLTKADGIGSGTSMDIIGAPRNCLFIHWRPQAKAAIRQAFDLFTREKRYSAVHLRDILVWELIEGVSEPLCNVFAELCGLMMANSRMTNPTNMVYVSQQSMRTTNHAIKLAVARLVNEACRYCSQHGPPSLSSNSGVDVYFGLKPQAQRIS